MHIISTPLALSRFYILLYKSSHLPVPHFIFPLFFFYYKCLSDHFSRSLTLPNINVYYFSIIIVSLRKPCTHSLFKASLDCPTRNLAQHHLLQHWSCQTIRALHLRLEPLYYRRIMRMKLGTRRRWGKFNE